MKKMRVPPWSMSFPLTCISLFLSSAESNGITNFCVKTNLVQTIAFSSTYDIIMSLEHFEIKNKVLRPLYGLKIDSYHMCLKISTVVAFGSESVKLNLQP